MPNPVDFNDRILLTGKTQSGKTTFVLYLLEQMRGCRRIVIDPKGHFSFPDTEPVRRPADLDPKLPLLHYVPSRLDDREYTELYTRIWAMRGPPTIVLLDEAMGPTSKSRWPQDLAVCVQQGDQQQLGHWACSQRPVDIAPALRTEAEHLFMFVPRPHYLNIRALAQETGVSDDELARRFDELQAREGDHSFLWYCRATNELVDCAPIPVG